MPLVHQPSRGLNDSQKVGRQGETRKVRPKGELRNFTNKEGRRKKVWGCEGTERREGHALVATADMRVAGGEHALALGPR